MDNIIFDREDSFFMASGSDFLLLRPDLKSWEPCFCGVCRYLYPNNPKEQISWHNERLRVHKENMRKNITWFYFLLFFPIEITPFLRLTLYFKTLTKIIEICKAILIVDKY